MRCPKCQNEDIIVATKEDGDIYICLECRAFWGEEIKVQGEISNHELNLYKNVIEWNTMIDQIDFEFADATNVEKCIFCDKLAVKDGDNYKCHSCGGSWSVV